jgi:hypothetical protein
MKKPVKFGWIAASLCTALFVGGCSSYYKVKDPQSGNVYYTQKVDSIMGSGAVKVKDARTGSLVTLQSSEVKEISEKEYKAGLAAPVSKPAPAAAVVAPVPAAASAVAPAPVVAPAAAAAPASAVVPVPAPAAAPSVAPAPTPTAEPSSAPGGTK